MLGNLAVMASGDFATKSRFVKPILIAAGSHFLVASCACPVGAL